MSDATTDDTGDRRAPAPPSLPSYRAPDISGPFRRPSNDPTLGEGRKPPTTIGWAPTPTLTDRRVLEAPAFVLVDDVASRDAAGARLAEGLERLGRPVERVLADATAVGGGRSPGRLGHPLVVHVGCPGALQDPTARTVARTVRAYRPGATISYDVTLDGDRPLLLDDVRPRVEALVSRSHVVKVSTRDLERLYADEAHDSVLRRWLSSGPGIVVVSDGHEGAWATNAAGVTATVHGEQADDVLTGDAFMAGIIDALWKAGLLGVGARHDLRTLVGCSLRELLLHAVAAAAIAARADGLPPTREELDAARGMPQLTR